MEGTWKVYAGEETVGSCIVERAGLYFRFRCRCMLPHGKVSRLIVTAGEKRQSLGVLVPGAGGFLLSCQIPVKSFPAGTPRFTIETQSERREPEEDQEFVPIKPEEPFAYLHRLEEAYLARKNGQIGIFLEKKQQDSLLKKCEM